ncbi:MAG: T9SS type A sorting domain-containing protein [Dysgonomonas sp.]
MKRNTAYHFFFLLLFVLTFSFKANGQEATCYSQSETQTDDFWMSHLYYAQCTDYVGSGSKLVGDGPYIDFNTGSAVDFTKIKVSKTGRYTVQLSYGIGYADGQGAQFKVYVNGEYDQTYTVYTLSQTPPATINIEADLVSGKENSIKLVQQKDWPTILGIKLLDVSEKELAYSFSSGNLVVNLYKESDQKYSLGYIYNGKEYKTIEPNYPISLEVRTQKLVGRYDSFTVKGDTLLCRASVVSTRGTVFDVADNYIVLGNGVIDMQRKIQIQTVGANDNYFNSFFGLQSGNGAIADNEYFVPGVWYKGNFEAECNLPANLPQATDTYFLYREDRITLPLVMSRNKENGTVIMLIHKGSDPQTVMADNNNEYVDENYQYGAIGMKQENSVLTQMFVYPGNEFTTSSGKGLRYHPVKSGIIHEYDIQIKFATTDGYAQAVKNTWETAFNLYDPTIYPVDLSATYDGILETLLKYYVPSTAQGGTRDAPGFPFEVSLTDFQPKGINYQMGFVGMQLPTGYYVFREGIEKNDQSTQEKGEAILNFWADNCLSTLGFPRTWYDPGLDGNKGSFRSGSDIRVATGGMEGLLTAWCFAKKNNLEKNNWINACVKFGNWLVANQNADGSYYFSYNHNAIVGDKHPVSDYNKYLTICAVRYLIELHIATGDVAYKNAALKAGDFCLANINDKYHYLACVVDNPRTIDSESGQMAINGFSSLYDLTKDKKWLDAAEQAATYTTSWVYSFEIPVEKDRTTATSFPKDRSIVGQHLIAVGHAAADLGFAWSSFVFYRLYLETGNEQYLKVARMSAHNSKQSMNWDGSLYPGQAKGLQLEAFPVTLPRRTNGVMTTLNWNYAAHLDPMFRFKDAFGTPDLEAIELLPLSERKRLNEEYSKVQSSNYGQQNAGISLNDRNDGVEIYPTYIKKNEALNIILPEGTKNLNIKIYNLMGGLVRSQMLSGNQTHYNIQLNLPDGQYVLSATNEHINCMKKILIK